MPDSRRRILCALALSLFFVAATPVASRAPDLVAINHKGRVIEVSPVASVFHILLHGDTLVDDDGSTGGGGSDCVPPECIP